MSGVAEASLVLGLVSSILTVLDTALQIYNAAHDAKGLTKTFQATADQIPLVFHTLELVGRRIQENRVGAEAVRSAKPVLERCKQNATKVKDAFDKALPSKDASRTERYKKAAEMRWRSSEVKENMKLVMEGLDLLAQHQIFQDADAMGNIKTAIDDLAKTSTTHDMNSVTGRYSSVMSGPTE